MKGKSILLALSGSKQSRQAAEVCWRLSTSLDASITAHHVIDSHSAWEFLGHDSPGYLDAAKYLEAYQGLLSSLFVLGEELSAAYAREAKRLGVDDICIVDEGNPITEICRRAANHKMVVIGHKKYSGKQPRSQFQRQSIAEALAHDCPRPLLVVQEECKNWTSLSIMISLDHINEIFINSCLEMSATLKIEPVLVCLTGGVNEEEHHDLVRDLRAANPNLQNVHIALTPAKQEIDIQIEHWFAPPGKSHDKSLWENTLMVVPTRMAAGERITVLDSSPSMFLRYLTMPSILLWPEEFVYNQNQTKSRSALQPKNL